MRWRRREHLTNYWNVVTAHYIETTNPYLERIRSIGARPPADIARECIAFDRRITRHPRGLA